MSFRKYYTKMCTHMRLRRYAALKVSDRLNPPLGNGGGMGKPVVRPAMPGSRREGGEERDEGWREHAGPWPGPTHVSGEWRAPATSQHPIRTRNDAGTTRRALLAPLPFAPSLFSLLCCPTPPPPPPSSLLHSLLDRTKPIFSIPLLHTSVFPYFILWSSPTLLSFILSLLLPSLLLCVWLLQASEFDDVSPLL